MRNSRPPIQYRIVRNARLDHDPAMDAFSAFTVFIAMLVCAGAFLVTDSPGGETAMVMAVITGAIFAARADHAAFQPLDHGWRPVRWPVADRDALNDLRSSLNLLALRQAGVRLASPSRKAVEFVLQSLARYFEGHEILALDRRIRMASARLASAGRERTRRRSGAE